MLDIYSFMPNAIKYNVSAETLALKKGDEIFTWYGDVSYWNDGRNHTSVV